MAKEDMKQRTGNELESIPPRPVQQTTRPQRLLLRMHNTPEGMTPMSKIFVDIKAVTAVLLLSAVAAVAQNSAPPSPGPVPAAILTAKNIFVSNSGADSGLFPHPFRGNPDRGYDQFYAALKSAGDFKPVGDPSQADLVLELRLTAPTAPQMPTRRRAPPIHCQCFGS